MEVIKAVGVSFLLIMLLLIGTFAYATPFNINEVEKWINVGPETFPGTPDKADAPVFRFNNTSIETWIDFHIRLPEGFTFVDPLKESMVTKFSKNGLSPDKRTWSFWDGKVVPSDFFGVGFDVVPGGNINFDVKATVPEPCTLFLLGSGLAGIIGFGRKKLFKKV